ncbi:hypothetical protein V6R21_03030 [Limibacter armeniacum]|uniref:hypothetical protein n=1 Tax=Limibacter armeniacum TaxID=466084 RepID=UPI002FE5F9D9
MISLKFKIATFLFIISLFFISKTAISQSYLITNDGDTIRGIIEDKSFIAEMPLLMEVKPFFYKVVNYDSNGKKITRVMGEDVKEAKVGGIKFIRKRTKLANSKKKINQLMEVVIIGYTTLYKITTTVSHYTPNTLGVGRHSFTSEQDSYYLEKPDGSLYFIPMYYKKMAKVFSDDPVTEAMILNRALGFRKIEMIVEGYNKRMEEKQKVN